MTEANPTHLSEEKDEIVRRLVNLIDEYGSIGLLAVESIIRRVQEEVRIKPAA